MFAPRTALFVLVLSVAAASCDDGASPALDAGEEDAGGRPRDTGDSDDESDGARPDLGGDDTDDLGSADTDLDSTDATADTAVDPGVDPDTDPGCTIDNDGDGHAPVSCGGDDCDDNNARRFGGSREFCDAIDNNCNNILNEGVDCVFWAHTVDMLYRVDPFTGLVEELGPVDGLLDIDTSADGTLYGVTDTELLVFDDGTATWDAVGDLGISGGAPNGLAITSRNIAYLTSLDDLYRVDLDTGAATLVGDTGQNFESSGDCVVNKDDTLYMTSKHLTDTDTLVVLNTDTAVGDAVGPIGVTGVYGLTAAWGQLFGVTRAGEIVAIDEVTGAGTVLHTLDGMRFYGAASAPER